MKRILFLSFIFLSLSGCSLVESKVPIFSGTTYILATAPENTISTSLPTFKWSAPDTEVVYQVVGVFLNGISIQNMQILNKEDCIAMWTTGMEGSAGDVNFSKFMKVTNGVLTSIAIESNTLGSGTNYYWAVWGYDKGMSITHSSGKKSFQR